MYAQDAHKTRVAMVMVLKMMTSAITWRQLRLAPGCSARPVGCRHDGQVVTDETEKHWLSIKCIYNAFISNGFIGKGTWRLLGPSSMPWSEACETQWLYGCRIDLYMAPPAARLHIHACLTFGVNGARAGRARLAGAPIQTDYSLTSLTGAAQDAGARGYRYHHRIIISTPFTLDHTLFRSVS